MRQALKVSKKIGKNLVILALLTIFLVVAHGIPALVTGYVDPSLSF